MNNNSRVIRAAFKEWEKEIEKEALKEIENFAQNLIYEAIKQRQMNPDKHDYTGNLLNSIVAAVYYKKDLKKAFFSGETGIREPRYYEMTASHGRYFFRVDYEGRESNYIPRIETLRHKGIEDAYEFISTFKPDTSDFVIVVAYTTDYALWIEQQRQTTGFVNTLQYAKKVAMKMFELKPY